MMPASLTLSLFSQEFLLQSILNVVKALFMLPFLSSNFVLFDHLLAEPEEFLAIDDFRKVVSVVIDRSVRVLEVINLGK